MVAFGKCAGGGRRAARRESTPLLVTLTTPTRTYTATLIDISATGARLLGDELPSIDEDLVVGLEKERVFSTVRWVGEEDFGVQFDEPLAQAQVIAVRRQVAKGAGLPPELRAALDDWVLGVAR